MRYCAFPLLRRPFLQAVTSVLVLSCASLSAQTILIQDSFTLNNSDREPGDTLDKTAPDTSSISGVTWKVNASSTLGLVFAEGGGITNGLTSAAEARIAIASPSSSITVKTDIGTGASAQWVAAGLLSSATTGNWAKASGADSVLWTLIKPNGNWEAYANGTSVKLGSGKVTGFSDSATYALGITYDPIANTTSSFLTSQDGTTITLLDNYNVSALVTASSIVAAGFRVNGTAIVENSVSIDNFLVTTSAIPEPNTVSMIMGSAAVFVTLLRLRRRS